MATNMETLETSGCDICFGVAVDAVICNNRGCEIGKDGRHIVCGTCFTKGEKLSTGKNWKGQCLVCHNSNVVKVDGMSIQLTQKTHCGHGISLMCTTSVVMENWENHVKSCTTCLYHRDQNTTLEVQQLRKTNIEMHSKYSKTRVVIDILKNTLKGLVQEQGNFTSEEAVEKILEATSRTIVNARNEKKHLTHLLRQMYTENKRLHETIQNQTVDAQYLASTLKRQKIC